MSLSLPASLQQVVGDRILRLGTSYDNTIFFVDIPRARPNSNRTRYGYTVTGGIVRGSYNLSPLLGNTVLSVSAEEDGSVVKIIFTTNPTSSKVEHSILYVDPNITEGYLLEEDGDFLLQENGDRILLEQLSVGGDTLTDATIPRNIFQSTDSDTKFFIIQEDDF